MCEYRGLNKVPWISLLQPTGSDHVGGASVPLLTANTARPLRASAQSDEIALCPLGRVISWFE